jgi:hypothetical protein
VPSLCDYHYRVKQLDDELLKSILEECAKLLLEEMLLALASEINISSIGREEHK